MVNSIFARLSHDVPCLPVFWDICLNPLHLPNTKRKRNTTNKYFGTLTGQK